MPIKDKDFQSAASEILALAVMDVFPSAKILATYSTDLGFALDFVNDKDLDETAYNLIDERMRILLKKDLTVEPIEMMRENAAELFRHLGQDLIAQKVLTDSNNIVSLLRIDGRYGYSSISCKLNSRSLGDGKLIKSHTQLITSEACGGWPVYTVEGVLCKDSKELKKFLKAYETARKNDFALLGPKLELFLIPETAIPGSWTWLPKGEIVKELLISWWKNSIQADGFALFSAAKWFFSEQNETKEHQHRASFLENRAKSEYLSDETAQLGDIFKLRRRHLKDLPLKFAEISQKLDFGKQTKDSSSRRAGINTRDTANSFCAEGQVQKELISSLQFLLKSFKIFAIDYQWYLVFNNPKTTGDQGSWDHGVDLLVNALEECGVDYKKDSMTIPVSGPRIEARLIDSLGREWEGPSVEIFLDKTLRDLFYQDRDDKERRPVLIRRSLFGSLETFVAKLVEAYAGLLPLWLAPEQVRVIPVREKHLAYAQQVCEQLLSKGIRASIDLANEPLASKIFAVKSAKVPYAIVVGDNEQRNGTIAVCPCKDAGEGRQEKLDAFIDRILNEIEATGPSDLNRGTKVELKTD